MKIAYLMLVHKNPRLLKRAIAALSSQNCGFFIHIDKKSDLGAFREVGGDNVFLSERRIQVYWSEFSNVEATLQLMRQALGVCMDYEYFVFMQGSDYPLRSSQYIEKFLRQNQGNEFISLVRMPAPGYPMARINTVRYTSDLPVRRFIFRLLAKGSLAQRDCRRHLGTLKPYAGDACWALSRSACEYILEFVGHNPQVLEYFRYTHVPEESLYHTILGNSPFLSRVRRSLLYRDYPPTLSHPALLTEKHIQFFESQDRVRVEDEWGSGEVLFARKFSDETLNLVDRIDEMIRRVEQQPPPPPVVQVTEQPYNSFFDIKDRQT